VKKKMKNDFDKKKKRRGGLDFSIECRQAPLYSGGVCHCAVFYTAQCIRATSEVLNKELRTYLTENYIRECTGCTTSTGCL
jgi:hypothetical protein